MNEPRCRSEFRRLAYHHGANETVYECNFSSPYIFRIDPKNKRFDRFRSFKSTDNNFWFIYLYLYHVYQIFCNFLSTLHLSLWNSILIFFCLANNSLLIVLLIFHSELLCRLFTTGEYSGLYYRRCFCWVVFLHFWRNFFAFSRKLSYVGTISHKNNADSSS